MNVIELFTIIVTFPLSTIGLVTLLLSSVQSESVSNQVGFGGGSGIFLLGGRKTQHPFAQSPLVPAPYTRLSGLKGKMMQIAGGKVSGIRISEVLV